MYNIEIVSNKAEIDIKEAICNLKNYEFEQAYKFILKALNENPNAPGPHNLLGIWYELKGNNDLARKHYRVAYVLDPTFKPATVNLERAGNLFPYKKIPVDFGDVMIEEISYGIRKEI